MFEIFGDPINSWRVTLEMGIETHVGLRLNFPEILSDFNQNWNVSTDLNKPQYRYQIP
jgi:hypothetical protein